MDGAYNWSYLFIFVGEVSYWIAALLYADVVVLNC